MIDGCIARITTLQPVQRLRGHQERSLRARFYYSSCTNYHV